MSGDFLTADANLRALADLNKRCQELEAKLAQALGRAEKAERERDAMRQIIATTAEYHQRMQQAELIPARELIAQLRKEYDPACTCDICRAIAAYDEKVRWEG